MILMIDNYDSFTYNLVQYLGELGANVKIYRNDEISLQDIAKLKPKKIILSPGPCTPNEAGITLNIITEFKNTFPILGICLGHQAIAQAFGGKIIFARQPMHGKNSLIYHNQQGVFHNLPNPFTATRYHSLILDKKSLPSCMTITAWTQDDNGNLDEIMGIKHCEENIEGVQFHPESITSEYGRELLMNFLSSAL